MKIFTNIKLTKKELRNTICVFAKQVGVKKVIFNNNGKCVVGTYCARNKHIYICNKQTKLQMLSTFFHELGHHEAVTKCKWKKFHFFPETLKKDTIFSIENKIDKLGKKLWNTFVNVSQWGHYKYSYPKSQKQDIIKHFITNYYND